MTLLLAFASHGALSSYSEMLELEWGEVTFLSNGAEETEEMWFTRQPPTFARGTSFSEMQRLCLSNAFLTLTGRVEDKVVWRITSNWFPAFADSATGERCLGDAELQSCAPAPEDGMPGVPKRQWEFCFEYPLAPIPPSPPTLEVALLTEDVPAKVAWKIDLMAALAEPDILKHAELSSAQVSAVQACAAWAQLFLVSPGTLSKPEFDVPGDFPRVEVVPNIREQSIPVAFGLRALAEAAGILAADRRFRDSSLQALRQRLSPNQRGAFPGAHRWFPEPDASRRAMNVAFVETGLSPFELLLVDFPQPVGPSTPRVLPETNEWLVRAGPFRRIRTPGARVAQVQGEGLVDVEILPEMLKDQPRLFRHYQDDIRDIESDLRAKLPASDPSAGHYFWLPDWTNSAALKERDEEIRDLEEVRYVQALGVSFVTNRLMYGAVYAPAEVHAKAGVSYNSAQGLGLEAEAGWAGLIRPGDALSLQATVAQRVLTGELSYSLRYHRSLDRRTTFHIELFGDAGRDENFRIGRLSRSPFEHDHRTGGVAHEIRHATDSWSWSERDEVSWDGHQLSDEKGVPRRDDDGLVLHHQQDWRFAPTAATNARASWEFSFVPSVHFAPDVGWAGSFWRGEISAGVRTHFGGTNREAMYVSLRASYGAGTARVPPALEYRLGDAERMLGLEPGEYSGRFFTHGELAYGFNLGPLLGRLLQGTNTTAAPPPLLNGLHLQALAEMGTISANGGRSANDPDGLLSSFGVALEKAAPSLGRDAGFRIGYAWSPDSLRRNGRLFTALSWSF